MTDATVATQPEAAAVEPSRRTTAPVPGTPLTGADAVHLHSESERTPMHTLKVCLLAPRDGQRAIDAQNVAAAVRRVTRAYAFFHVVAVPALLGHPRWRRVTSVDLTHHVRVATVASPGGRHEVDRAIGEITEGRLPAGLPPWQAWVLDGLSDGRVAVVFKLHHALADGGAAAHLLEHLAAQPSPVPDADLDPEPVVVTPVADRLAQLAGLPRLVADTVAASAAVRALDLPSLGLPGPSTLLRRKLGAARSYATCSLPLADVQAARGAVPGATVNDVVLCLAGGAVRRILQARRERTDIAVGAGLPVSTDPVEGPARLWGNSWEQLLTTLASDQADPVARMQAIHDATRGAKQVRQAQSGLLARWLEQVPPLLIRAAGTVAGLLPRFTVPLPGVTVSNVRGPAQKVCMPRWGFELDEFYSVGPVLDGIGLNITAWSYAGRMCVVALTGTQPLIPATEVTAALEAELELVAAAGRAARG